MLFTQKILGSVIKKYRKTRGLRQNAVSAATGISAPHLSSVESGKRGITDERLLTLLAYYNIDKDTFLEDIMEREHQRINRSRQHHNLTGDAKL